jgi:predicted NACHT family NTPase
MALAEGLLVAAGKGFLDAVSPAIKKKFDAFLQKFDWQTAQRWYYEKIEKDYGSTRILGKPEPVKLEGIFTDVFLLDKPTAFQRFNILQLQSEPDLIKTEQERLSGLDLVKGGRLERLYILGKPGAGKTTFLKYVALKASKGEIRKIPIFVSLKEWADSDLELMPFLVKQFDICRFPDAQPLIEYILEQGLAIVLFDGLDETQHEGGKRDQIINDIRDFSRKYDDSQVLITCRIAATDYTFEEFSYLEVADFTEKQVNHYVEKYFADDEEKQKQFKAEFGRDDNKRLREMASTPLLLSLLCLNFEQTGYFPQRRVEIYEEGINALLTKWDATRNIRRDHIYKGLELGRKRQMFARIAAQTFENNDYFLPKNKLAAMIVDYLCQLPDSPAREDIDGEAVLKAIEAQHSIFVERAQNIYSFSHLSFQEYFAAKYTVDNVADGTLKRLLTSQNVFDDRWREVILNTASLLDNADSFIKILFEIADSFISKDEKLIPFFEWVKVKLETISPDESIVEAKRLYSLSGIVLDLFSQDSPSKNDNLLFTYHSLVLELIFHGDILPYKPYLDIQISIIIATRLSFTSDRRKKYDLIKEIFAEFSEKTSKFISRNKNIAINERTNLKEARNELNILSETSKNEELEITVERLFQIIRKYFNIGFQWDLSEEQRRKIEFYNHANKLIADCLRLAVVSNRQEIEDRLRLKTG